MDGLIQSFGMLGAAGFAMFCFVFLKAFQQRNVAFDAPWWVVLLLSYGMALTEVYVVSVIARQGFTPELVLSIGTGSGWGAVIAMAMHRKVFGTQGSNENE
jgi:hypothetical protein